MKSHSHDKLSDLKKDISCTRSNPQKFYFCDWNIRVSWLLKVYCLVKTRILCIRIFTITTNGPFLESFRYAITRIVFLGQPQDAYDFSNFNLTLCLQYAWNNRVCCQGHDPITTPEGPIRIHYSAKTEKAIQWYVKINLNYSSALKSHP